MSGADRMILLAEGNLRRLATALRSVDALDEERRFLEALLEDDDDGPGPLVSDYIGMMHDLARAPTAAAELAERSPEARICVLFGEPDPWRLADTEGRAIVRGRRLADVLPSRMTRAIVPAAGLLLAVLLALVTACTAPPRQGTADHGAELARVGADGPKPPGPLVALDRDGPAPIPPAPTPWDLYGAAALAGAAAGYSLVRLRRG